MNYTTTSTSILQQGWLPIIAKQAIIFGMIFFLATCSTDEETTPAPPGGNGWTYPADLDDSISSDSSNIGRQDSDAPQVAMDNNGNAIITWTQHNPDPAVNRHEIFKSEYRNGAWIHPTDLSTDNISPAGMAAGGHVYPQVAMNDSGQAVIAWKGVDVDVIYRTFVSDYNMTTVDTWEHPTDLTDNISPATTNAQYQQVAMDNSGNTFVVWEQSNSTNTQIFKSDYNITTLGAWSPIPALSDSPLSPDLDNTNGGGLGAAMDNNGNALVTWAQHDTAGSNRHEIFKGDYNMTITGDWTPATFANNINSAIGSALYPQVAMNDSDQAVIVWREQNSPGGDFEIYRNDYNMTSPGDWSGAVKILDARLGRDAGDPQVAMDNTGNAIIVWAQFNPDANRDEIFMSEYRFNNISSLWEWHDPDNLNDNISQNGRGAEFPQVAMDNNGNAIIVWMQYSASTPTCLMGSDTCKQIFKSEYRNGNWAHPADLTSASYISPNGRDAEFPQVAMDDKGNAIIVWQQYDNTDKCLGVVGAPPSGACKQIFKSEYRP